MEYNRSIIHAPSPATAPKASINIYRKMLIRNRLYKATSITYDSKRCLGKLSRTQSLRLIRELTLRAIKDTRPLQNYACDNKSGVWLKVGAAPLPQLGIARKPE